MAKKDYDKTLTRLISILSMLSLNRLPNTKELAEEFNVTTRTIQKDIYTRLYNFFPIEKDTEGRFKFVDGFSLNKSLLDSEEMILVALGLSQFYHVKDFDHLSNSIVQKLLYPKMFNPYYIKNNTMEALNTNSKLIHRLREAIEESHIITMTFAQSVVDVEPYKIANFDGFWYLFGKDIKNQKVKTFMISKIESLECTVEKHEVPHAHIDKTLGHTHSAWFEDGEGFEVVIKVYPEIAHYFKQKDFLVSQEIVDEHEDGSLHVSFDVTHDEDIDNMIKAWLPHIEVLKPERFRSKIIDELEAYIGKLRG